ncbi:MAG: aminopeptidase P family protein [Actinomycetota bacterium]|nr:aminopeptidase P family protein [Actinomycetota bacterium]
MDHAGRLAALRQRITEPLLVSRLPNLRYLTGFQGSNGYLLIAKERSVFVTDGRYGEVAARLVEALPGTDLEVYQGPVWPVLGKVLDGLARVSLEANGVTWSFARRLAEEVSGELHPAERIVEALRMRKDEGEVAALRRAAGAGDHAFSRLPELLEDAGTEADVGRGLLESMRQQGGERPEWEPIVAAGANAALPHHRAGGSPVGHGLLLLDYGCQVDGYHSDMSRTVWLDGQPEGDWAEIHHAVREAQEAAIAAVRPGVPAREVDQVARRSLAGRGYGEFFVHSTGHGVGLEIHEDPKVSTTSEDTLAAGQVITVEPGVYLPGRGGVRIEDMVLVSEDGPVVLTGSAKELA